MEFMELDGAVVFVLRLLNELRDVIIEHEVSAAGKKEVRSADLSASVLPMLPGSPYLSPDPRQSGLASHGPSSSVCSSGPAQRQLGVRHANTAEHAVNLSAFAWRRSYW